MKAEVHLTLTPEQWEVLQRALGTAFWACHANVIDYWQRGFPDAAKAAQEQMGRIDEVRTIVANTPITIQQAA